MRLIKVVNIKRLERTGLSLGYLYKVISEHTLELNTGRYTPPLPVSWR